MPSFHTSKGEGCTRLRGRSCILNTCLRGDCPIIEQGRPLTRWPYQSGVLHHNCLSTKKRSTIQDTWSGRRRIWSRRKQQSTSFRLTDYTMSLSNSPFPLSHTLSSESLPMHPSCRSPIQTRSASFWRTLAEKRTCILSWTISPLTRYESPSQIFWSYQRWAVHPTWVDTDPRTEKRHRWRRARWTALEGNLLRRSWEVVSLGFRSHTVSFSACGATSCLVPCISIRSRVFLKTPW